MSDGPDPGTGATPQPEPGGADPVLVQRARMQRVAQTGQRVGYGLFAVAVVLFFVGFPTGFPGWLITGIIACLAVGSIVLAPAIVIGYGVQAADREDRDTGHAT